MEKFELLRTLIGAKHVLSLFPDAHPMVQEKVEKLLEVIEALIAQEKKAEISIVGEEVFINEHSFRQESLENLPGLSGKSQIQGLPESASSLVQQQKSWFH